MNVKIGGNYQPHPSQRRFHGATQRFSVATAGVRGGKTTAGSVEFPVRIYRDLQAGRVGEVHGIGRQRRPRWHGWIVAPRYSQLKEALRCFFEHVPPELIEGYYPSDNSIWLKPDILIEGKSADQPHNLVAVGLNGLWVTEAARLKADAWSGALRSRLSDKNGWAIFDTSPFGGKGNWLYQEIVSRALAGNPDYASTSWRTIDNTAIPGLAEEVASAERDLPAAYFARDYLADWSSFANLVYADWSEPIHVVTEAALRLEYGLGGKPLRSIFKRVIGAIDWGFVEPSCILAIGDTGRELIVLEESYGPGRVVYDSRLSAGTLAAEAMRLKTEWGADQFFADPSEPGDIFDMRRAGVHITGADNELLYGIKRVSTRLHPVDGRPRLRVLDRCANLRREMAGYVWETARDGVTFVEVPKGGNDHSLDTLRYGVVELTKYERMHGTDERRHTTAVPIG